jgi:uncharacterized protein with HEPN domain
MKRDYKLYLKDILEAMESVEKFVQGMDFERFKKDDKTVSAVVRKFEIIGEATKQIPDKIRQDYPGIPWKEMAGMRDRLIHFYFGVDYKLVWETIKKRLPKIIPQIGQILKKLE